MNQGRSMTWIWVGVATAALVAAGAFQAPIERLMENEDLVPPGNVVTQNHPQVKLMTTMFGGLRSAMLAVLWIRASEAHQAGNHYDALQLAELICELEPYSPGVWDYQAWQMAWNISVTKHTGEERWRWVYNGIKLLRDKGLMLNPRALILFKQLSWIFLDKMGDNIDEQHLYYKRRWAYLMQRLLGAPPYGDAAQVADAFRPVAKAPLDRTRRRQGLRRGGQLILQADTLAAMAASDKAVAAFLGALAKAGWTPLDEERQFTGDKAYELLDRYNELSDEDEVAAARPDPVVPEEKARTPMYAAMNAPAHKAGRDALVAFVRSQLLWNEYKLDPKYMLYLMEDRYKAPLDWRLPFAHGLYWADMGIDLSGRQEEDIDWLNTARNEVACLKLMAFQYGRLVFTPNAADPENPRFLTYPDPRFIAVAHKAIIEAGRENVRREVRASKSHDPERLKLLNDFGRNQLRDGHVNFLIDAIFMLYRYGWHAEAQYYYEQLWTLYDPKRELYNGTLDRFMEDRFKEPIATVAQSQLRASLTAGLHALSYGDRTRHANAVRWARTMWESYAKDLPERIRGGQTLEETAGVILAELIVEPRIHGYIIPMRNRSRMYMAVAQLWRSRPDEGVFNPQCYAYGLLTARRAAMDRLCRQHNYAFDELFPKPSGFDEFIQFMQDRQRTEERKAGQPTK